MMKYIFMLLLVTIIAGCSDKKDEQVIKQEQKPKSQNLWVNSSMFSELTDERLGGDCAGFTSYVTPDPKNRYNLVSYIDLDMIEVVDNLVFYHHVSGETVHQLENEDAQDFLKNVLEDEYRDNNKYAHFDAPELSRRLPRNNGITNNKYYQLSTEQVNTLNKKIKACSIDLTARVELRKKDSKSPKDLEVACTLGHGNSSTELDMYLAQYTSFASLLTYYPIYGRLSKKDGIILEPIITDKDKDGMSYYGVDTDTSTVNAYAFRLINRAVYSERYTGIDLIDRLANLTSAYIDSYKEINPLWQFNVDHLDNGKFTIYFYPQDPHIASLRPGRSSEYFLGEYSVGEKINFKKSFNNFHIVNDDSDYESITVELSCQSLK